MKIKQIDEIDIEVAGEFLVMAATLMYIKSRTLLPRHEQPRGRRFDLLLGVALDAPRARVPQSFWASSPLDGDISHVARTTSIDVLLRHYTSFVDTYFGVDAAAATAPALAPAARRERPPEIKLANWSSALPGATARVSEQYTAKHSCESQRS